MDIIKTMGDFKIPQFTLLTSPEQDEIGRQREAEAGILPPDPEKNIDVLEAISKWDELMPSIQNFKE